MLKGTFLLSFLYGNCSLWDLEVYIKKLGSVNTLLFRIGALPSDPKAFLHDAHNSNFECNSLINGQDMESS